MDAEAVGSLIPLLLIAVLFYLLLIRPASRRQKEMRAVQAAAQPGSAVMLTSGIFGTVVSTDDDALQVEIAPGTVVKVARGAIATVKDTPDAAAEPDSDLEEQAEAADLDPTTTREQ